MHLLMNHYIQKESIKRFSMNRLMAELIIKHNNIQVNLLHQSQSLLHSSDVTLLQCDSIR